MKTIVVGNTEYSVMLMEYLEDAGVEIDAFCVNRDYIQANYLSGKKVISTETISDYVNPAECDLYLGIGYAKTGKVKKSIFEQFKAKGYSFKNYIHPTAVIHKSVMIGEGNVFFENVVVQRNVSIGDGNLFFSNAVIMHDNNIGNCNTFGACSVSNGFVKVGDCNFLGSNSTVKDHAFISSDCLIGAGAFVNRDCEKGMAILPAPSNRIEQGGYLLMDRL